MLFPVQISLACPKQEQENVLSPLPSIFMQKRGQECCVKSSFAKKAGWLKEDEAGSDIQGYEAMTRSRKSIVQTQNIIVAASKCASSQVPLAINLDSILQRRDSVKTEQERESAAQELTSSKTFKRIQLLGDSIIRLSENSVWSYCAPINSSVPTNTQIPKIRQQKSSHRRSLATNERPMNNFGGTLKKILLQKFKNFFGSRFKQIELLVKLESKWLGKELLQELFNSSQLRPVIAGMFATKHFHKAFRLSKVRSPECLAKFMRQIDAYQEAFQCGKIERVEMRE